MNIGFNSVKDKLIWRRERGIYALAKQETKSEIDLAWLSDCKARVNAKEIAITNQKNPDQVISQVLQSGVKHLVQEAGLFLKDELDAALHMMRAPQDYLDYPLSTLFPSSGLDKSRESELVQFEYKFNSNKQKSDILDAFEKFFKSFSDSESFLNDLSLVIDELFTNAMYDAPENNLENTASGKRRDGQEFHLPDGKFGRIFAGKHKNCLAIGCEDPFGTLNVKKILERISLCLTLGADKMIRFGEGGAGIGSYLLFMASTSLYIGVRHQQKTVICSLIPIGLGDRRRNEMPKNIHYCELPEE